MLYPLICHGVFAFTQPPANFDPRAASDDELASWGYPPRPNALEGPAAQANWLTQVSRPLQRVVPDLVSRPDTYNRQLSGLKINPKVVNGPIPADSSNWSGFALTAGVDQQPFSTVIGRWTVPTVKQAPGTCSGGWDYSSQWVGLGGFNDAYLLQAGSATNVFCDIGQNITEYFPWVEWLPASELVIYKNAATYTLYPFAPGDYLEVSVFAKNFSGGVSTTGYLTYADVTQGWSFTLSFSAASVGGSGSDRAIRRMDRRKARS